MEVIKFMDVYDNDISSFSIDRNEIDLATLNIPNKTTSFIYVNDDIAKFYRIGLKILDISVLKMVNLKQYEDFLKYDRENGGAEYSVCFIDGQYYFNCSPINTIFVDDMRQLQLCLYAELDLSENVKKR